MQKVEELIQELAKNIKQARKNKNISQMKLSEMAEISQSYLANIEIGKYSPSLETIIKISLALEINPGELFPKAYPPTKKNTIQKIISLLNELQD